MMQYNDVLKGSMKQMLRFALEETDKENRRVQFETIKESFSLDEKQLSNYMLIITIEKLYMDMNTYLDICSEFRCVNDNLDDELRELLEEFYQIKASFSKLLDKALAKSNDKAQQHKYTFSTNFHEEDLKLYPELSFNNNFIIYLSNIESERKNTVETRSGRGTVSMSSICKELSLLSKSNYELLKRNSKIHQIQERGKGLSGQVLTDDKVAFERIGGGSTKIGYIRIPIIRQNFEWLKGKYKNDNLRYLILVISFGDFKNEGIDETRLYDIFNAKADKNMSEIEDIIKIFKEPFTPESFEIAISMIEQGIDITRSLTDSPLEPLVVSNRLKNGK